MTQQHPDKTMPIGFHSTRDRSSRPFPPSRRTTQGNDDLLLPISNIKVHKPPLSLRLRHLPLLNRLHLRRQPSQKLLRTHRQSLLDIAQEPLSEILVHTTLSLGSQREFIHDLRDIFETGRFEETLDFRTGFEVQAHFLGCCEDLLCGAVVGDGGARGIVQLEIEFLEFGPAAACKEGGEFGDVAGPVGHSGDHEAGEDDVEGSGEGGGVDVAGDVGEV